MKRQRRKKSKYGIKEYDNKKKITWHDMKKESKREYKKGKGIKANWMQN